MHRDFKNMIFEDFFMGYVAQTKSNELFLKIRLNIDCNLVRHFFYLTFS